MNYVAILNPLNAIWALKEMPNAHVLHLVFTYHLSKLVSGLFSQTSSVPLIDVAASACTVPLVRWHCRWSGGAREWAQAQCWVSLWSDFVLCPGLQDKNFSLTIKPQSLKARVVQVLLKPKNSSLMKKTMENSACALRRRVSLCLRHQRETWARTLVPLTLEILLTAMAPLYQLSRSPPEVQDHRLWL